jgi:hypothetical protein
MVSGLYCFGVCERQHFMLRSGGAKLFASWWQEAERERERGREGEREGPWS